MTIEEIIKEAFSRGWNASHECATDFDYDCALNGFLSEVETEVKKFRIGAVSGSYTSGEIIAAWTRCKENRGLGYVVTLQDLLSELSNYH